MIVDVRTQTVRWAIVPRGAARNWTEREAVVVALRDHTGATGLGEAAPLPGRSIDTLDDARRELASLGGFDEPPALASPAARFALESALRRVHGVVAPPRLLRYAVVVDDADEARRAGSRCLKIKQLDRIAEIARAAPDARLRIDVNRAWPRDEVKRRMAELRGLPIEFVEEPCVEAHELLDEALPFRIALDESLVTLDARELARALRSPQLAALILKPTVLGGFRRCHELADEARRHGVAPIVSHALEGPIGLAACHELAREIDADVPVGLGPC